jgi:opacity protein-like surface antigen
MYRIVILFIACVAAARGAAGQTQQQPPTAQQEAEFPDTPSEPGIGKIAYVFGHVGVAATADVTDPSADAGGGFWLSSHVSVFCTYGMYQNLQTSVSQPYVNVAISQLAQRHISVTGEARTPAQYALGGIRIETEPRLHFTPYVLAGVGYARAKASAKFSYGTGSATVSGETAQGGEDATQDILSSGVFVGDDWNAMMFRVGGGASVEVWRSVFLDIGYSMSRIMAPTAITDHAVRFGLGYRF